MTARSSRSFVRRTTPRSITPAQVGYLRRLLTERDIDTDAIFPAMRDMLASLDPADVATIKTLSLAAAEDFITALLACPVR